MGVERRGWQGGGGYKRGGWEGRIEGRKMKEGKEVGGRMDRKENVQRNLTKIPSYPSGKIAVCTARNVVGEGKYTYVYATDDETLLAYFTPTNACCYDRNGKL